MLGGAPMSKNRIVHSGPDLICAGAPKSATTTIFESFVEIGLAKQNVKEFNYFSKDCVNKTNYYGKAVDRSLEEYEVEMSKKTSMLNLDFSPSYFSCPDSASLIKRTYPEVRLLFVIRDPVARAISHFNMDKRLGLVNHELSEIINSEIEPFYSEYLRNSKIAENLSRYFCNFGPESIIILTVDDIISNFQGSMASILSHLGISEKYRFNELRRNQNLSYRSKLLRLMATSDFCKTVYRILPAKNLLNFFIYKSKKADSEHKKIEKLDRLLYDDSLMYSKINRIEIERRPEYFIRLLEREELR